MLDEALIGNWLSFVLLLGGKFVDMQQIKTDILWIQSLLYCTMGGNWIAHYLVYFIIIGLRGYLNVIQLSLIQRIKFGLDLHLFIIIMKSTIHLILILACLSLVRGSVDPVWSPIPSIRAGQVQCVTSLLTAEDKSINVTTPYSNPINNGSNTTDLQHGISLISYESWMTDTFSFNITLENITFSGADVRFQVLDNTFMTKAKIHYIVIWSKGPDMITSLQYKMQVIYGCYLTNELQISPYTDNRNQTVGGVQQSSLAASLAFPYNQLVVKSMISGMQLSNSIGNNNNVKIIPKFLANSTIFYTAQVQSNNLLTFFCVSTVIIDPSIHKVTYTDNVEYQTYTLTSTNSGLSSVPYMYRYDGSDRMFFGISQFNLSMSDTRYLNVETSNISLVSLLYASNSALNKIAYNAVYFAQRNCTLPTYYDPVNYTCVDDNTFCVNSVAVASANLCNPCHYSCLTCTVGADKTACSTCPANSFRNANGTKCDCDVGYADVGVTVCQLCNKTLVGCLQCSDNQTCTRCNTQIYNLSGSVCTCPNNTYMASGYCLNYTGCLIAQSFNNMVICKLCDSSNNYINVTSNYSCICNTGYIYNSTNLTCYDECGDNKTAVGKCDDGNRVSGDGCDANCNVETGYHCSTNVTGGKSDCVLKRQITVSYLYAERTIETNSFIMAFLVSPTQSELTSSSFNSNFNTTIPLISQKLTFDPTSSIIYLQGTYEQDIQSTTYSASISFNNMNFYADQQSITFNAVGINAQLVVDKNASSNSMIKYIVVAEALIALLLAIFASIVGLKFVGIQLLIPVQLIYFSLATLPQQRTYTFVLNNLKYANGFNTITSYSYKRTYSQNKNLVGMNYQTEFLLSTNIMLGIFILVLIWLLVHHFILKYKYYKLESFLQSHSISEPIQQNSGDEQDDEQQDQQKRKLKKRRTNSNSQLDRQQAQLREDHHRSFKFFSFEVDRIYFIFYLNLINQMMFGFIVMTLNVPITSFIYAQEVNVLICNFIFFIFIGNIVFISYDQQSNKMIVFTCIKDRYAYAFLLLDFIIITILSMTFQQSYSTYLVCALSSSFALLVIKEKPYNKVFLTMENLITFYLQVMLLLCQIILCMVRTSKQDGNSLTYTFLIIGLIAIGEILTVIRIVNKVNFKKAFDDLKNPHKDDENDKKLKKVIQKNLDLLEEDKNVQIVPPQSVRNGLFAPKDKMVDWQSKNTEEYQSMRQRERQEVSEEDENRENRVQQQEFSENKEEKLNELQILKKRLRNNLKQKKQQDMSTKKGL